jgi:integrase
MAAAGERPFYSRALEDRAPGALGPAVDRFVAVCQAKGLDVKTIYGYRVELCRLAAMFPDRGVAELTPAIVEDYYLERCKDEGRRPGGRISDNTRQKVVAALSQFATWLHDRGDTRQNAAVLVTKRRPRDPEPDPTAWEPHEVRAILRSAVSLRNRALLKTLARTAQRQTPVRLLTWDRVYLNEGEIRFPRGKGGRFHTVPIDDDLVRELTLLRAADRPGEEDFVFRSRSGGPLSSAQLNRIVLAACDAASVRRATSHEFRRSAITNLSNAGVDFSLVSKSIAGHRNPQTTLRHYRVVRPEQVKRAYRYLDY